MFCTFQAWMAAKGYSREYGWPISHSHEETGAVNITTRRLGKPRSTKSHQVKQFRRRALKGGWFPEPPRPHCGKGLKVCPKCRGINPEMSYSDLCKWCYVDLSTVEGS